MRIAFDLDGVLADFPFAVITELRERFGWMLPDGYQMHQWSFAEFLTPVQWSEIFDHLMAIENFWCTLVPRLSDVEALRHHIETQPEDEIYYITARPQSAGASTVIQTQLWLSELGLGPIGANVIVTEQKVAALLENKIEFYIDDLPSTVAAANLQLSPRCKSFVLDQLYNREMAYLPRVYSVAEFLLEVESVRS